MPYRAIEFASGCYYHVFNRGASRGLIFFNDGNYEYLLRLIKRYRAQLGATILAYCLMPNHYHFLLRQETDQPLSAFMQVVFNAYTQAVNRQQQRTGTLFEGRFKHIWIDQESYLTHLCRYIHLNPVLAHMTQAPEDWAYSNYREWIGTRKGALVDHDFVREHFDNAQAYRDFVNDWVDIQRHETQIARYLFK